MPRVFPHRFRLPCLVAACLAALLLAPAAAAAAAESARPAGYDPARLPGATDYFTLRAGLDHARARFAAGGPARVAFLGGSITAMSGWRERVMADLRRRFPRTEFDFIGAGIGSLGSVPHAFRFSRDVLARGEVDLLFVEAAVNDASNIPDQPARMLRGMEGVVRQARLANPRMGIIHLHFAMPEHLEAYRAGQVPEVIRQHERVAAAYGNPSVDLARELTERIAAGQFSWEKDIRNLHPSPFGHEVYAAAIGRLLDAAWAEVREPGPVRPLPAAPLDPGSYFRGRLVDPATARVVRGFTLDPAWRPADGKPGRAGFMAVPALVSTGAGAELEFAFTGTAAGLFLTAGPDTARLEVSIDGGPFAAVDTWTRWSATLHLPWALILADGLPSGPHQCRVRLAARPAGEPGGEALRVFHLLVN
jgi:sialidase-1